MGKIKQNKHLGTHRQCASLAVSGGGKMPLADEIESLRLVKTKSNVASAATGAGAGDAPKSHHQNDERFVNEKITAKILNEARKQQSELQEEYGIGGLDDDDDHHDEQKRGQQQQRHRLNAADTSGAASSQPSSQLTAIGGGGNNTRQFKKFQSNFIEQQKIRKSTNQSDSDSDTSDNELDPSYKRDYYSDEEVQINETDEKAFDLFMSNKAPARRTIADIIMEKLAEKKTEIQTQMSEYEGDGQGAGGPTTNMQVDERVVKMYTQIKDLLKKYRSGKLPKAFKILPSLTNWENILYLTEPDSWSAAAVYQATRIFASNLNAKMAQRFYSLVLLPRIRDDIVEYKRLNFHLYMALRKALFKPAAFFKGILLPLCESRNCTLREAIIIGSVLAKNSIPMLHSAAALLKIAEMDYSGANSIFIRILLDKKYALPYRVIDAIVNHFVQYVCLGFVCVCVP
jgi:hypothetical protein